MESAYSPAPSTVGSPNADVIEQIRKVMRLARRAATDGERTAAESAAKRLATKHGVDLDTISETDSEITVCEVSDGAVYTNVSTELSYITPILRLHFGVIPVQCRRGRKMKLTWIGTKINIEIARHVCAILIRESRAAWGKARTVRRQASSIRKSALFGTDAETKNAIVRIVALTKTAFLDGWFWTINDKLTKNPLRNDMTQLEAERKAAEDFLKANQEAERLSIKDKSHEVYDSYACAFGANAAKTVNLNRTCGGTPPQRAVLA